jgi:hypothetical protein
MQVGTMGRLAMPDWYSHHVYLMLGIICWSGGMVSTCIGKTWAPHAGRTIYHAKEPSTFWWVVAVDYIFALVFVGVYMHQMGVI